MKKKSHLSLANYLIYKTDSEDLKRHKKSFLFGSILPDCVPSFITRRHTIDETFDILKNELVELIDKYDWSQGITGKFCRQLGVITHYLADYFTYPHNNVFTGSMREHISYEINLMKYLRTYLDSGEASATIKEKNTNLYSVDNVCNYIRETHEQYLQALKQISIDCKYIVEMVVNVVKSILNILEVNLVPSQVKVA